MKNTLQDLNVFLHPKQKEILNTLTESNPILGSIPLKPASHGIYNVYSKATAVDEMDEVDFDQELPTVGISFELGQARLGKIGGTLPMPKDASELMGGYSKYADDRLPTLIAKAGNAQETRIYYKGLLKTAIDNGNYVSCGGTTANGQYSMVAVHWDPASTIGLYNAKDVGSVPNMGSLFRTLLLNGGNEYKVSSLNNAIGKEISMWMQFGLQLADPRYVRALVNIEPTADTTDPDKIKGLPTPTQLDDLINDARGNGTNTVIYCNPKIQRLLGLKYKLEERKWSDPNTNITYTILSWMDVQFVASHNIAKGTEAVVA